MREEVRVTGSRDGKAYRTRSCSCGMRSWQLRGVRNSATRHRHARTGDRRRNSRKLHLPQLLLHETQLHAVLRAARLRQHVHRPRLRLRIVILVILLVVRRLEVRVILGRLLLLLRDLGQYAGKVRTALRSVILLHRRRIGTDCLVA